MSTTTRSLATRRLRKAIADVTRVQKTAARLKRKLIYDLKRLVEVEQIERQMAQGVLPETDAEDLTEELKNVTRAIRSLTPGRTRKRNTAAEVTHLPMAKEPEVPVDTPAANTSAGVSTENPPRKSPRKKKIGLGPHTHTLLNRAFVTGTPKSFMEAMNIAFGTGWGDRNLTYIGPGRVQMKRKWQVDVDMGPEGQLFSQLASTVNTMRRVRIGELTLEDLDGRLQAHYGRLNYAKRGPEIEAMVESWKNQSVAKSA